MAFWGRLRDLIEGPEPGAAGNDQERIHRAAALLLVEIGRADHDDHPDEARVIAEAVSSHFGLSEEDARELLEAAHAERDHAVSFDHHIATINEHFSVADKKRLLRFLWRVALADGELHHYEEHLVRRICDLLYLSHADFIRSRLEVRGN